MKSESPSPQEINMKIVRSLLLISLLCCAVPGLARKLQGAVEKMETRNLMPVPAKFSFQPGRFAIDANFSILLIGNISGVATLDERLNTAVRRMNRRLENRTGLNFSSASSGTSGATLTVHSQTT